MGILLKKFSLSTFNMKMILVIAILFSIFTEKAYCDSGFSTSDIVAKYENRKVLETLANQLDTPDVIGSEHKEVEDDFFNTDAEIRGSAKAFHKFDKDNDSFLSKAEFKNKNKDITNEEIKEAFDIIDSDGDGQISFEEFEAVPDIPEFGEFFILPDN